MSKYFWFAILYIVCAPFIGGLLEGIDRKVAARMQGAGCIFNKRAIIK